VTAAINKNMMRGARLIFVKRGAFLCGDSRQQTSAARLQGRMSESSFFRPGDWGRMPPTSRGESHADLSAMTARPPACYKQKREIGLLRFSLRLNDCV